MEETRQWERLNGLPAKQLFAHGYGPLDSLLKAAAERPAPPKAGEGGLRVLVAPSWGPDGLLETCGKELIEILLAAGHHVTARPHPRTRQLRPQVLEDLGARFGEHSDFELDEGWSSQEPLLDAHIMISDWSGIAMEFAFGLERPVLFVDVPRKINNPEYTRLDAVPLEVVIREEIGSVLSPGRLDEAPAALAALCRDWEAISERARFHRNKWIYNAGRSGIHGAEIIVELAQRDKSFITP
jgi:YidC/Oxa1 family membrane protein insertase